MKKEGREEGEKYMYNIHALESQIICNSIFSYRRRPGRTRDNLVDQAAVLQAYPDLVKPEDLEF